MPVEETGVISDVFGTDDSPEETEEISVGVTVGTSDVQGISAFSGVDDTGEVASDGATVGTSSTSMDDTGTLSEGFCGSNIEVDDVSGDEAGQSF